MATSQDLKYSIGLSGEFFVTAELLRRGITAAVTYGNAKKADVVAVSNNTAVKIEVKSSQRKSWPLGSSLPSADEAPIWVLADIPQDLKLAPKFFVLTVEELLAAIAIRDTPYRERYLARHGTPFIGPGMYKVSVSEIAAHAGRWDKITDLLKPQIGNPK